ncbi:MAG: hypothetical protein AB9873_07215 [Syntrophobacteraceae bacterium]
MQLEFPSFSITELKSNPGNVLFSHPRSVDWLKSKRWFMDKDAEILEITSDDWFQVEIDESTSICGQILALRLGRQSGMEYRKRYFVPLISSSKSLEGIAAEDIIELLVSDGKQYMAAAEHSSLFQRFFLRSLQANELIVTRNSNSVSFLLYGSGLTAIDTSGLVAEPLRVSTSNVLTRVLTDRGHLITKCYKDMRGDAGPAGKRWPPNMEMVRYEALAASGYENMPQLHGVSSYTDRATGASVPLMLLMDKINGADDLGCVFWAGLSQLLDTGGGFDDGIRALNRKAIGEFSRLLAFTVADFHHAFLRSDKPGFEAVQASASDVAGWSQRALNRYEQAVLSLERRSSQRLGDVVLGELVERLRTLAPFELPSRLSRLAGRLKKAQIHGDLSTAQGLIDWSGGGNPISFLFDQVASGMEGEALDAVEGLVRRVRWMDFEGEPAREMLDRDHDTRQNLLVDVAGVLQGFWYLGNTKLYKLLGLQPAINPAHQESARKASLVLAGQIAADEANLEGLAPQVVVTIQEWLAAVSDAFVEGYLDKVEESHMEEAILADWDRGLARGIVDFWVVFRALHELRYETYGRDFGWESIPAGRILELTPKIDLANHAET